MNKQRVLAVVAASALVAAAVVASAAGGAFGADTQVAHGSSQRQPKNVIFLLGDGMGTQEITAARYYQGVTTAQRRPHGLHRLRHHLVGQARRQRALPARLRPDSASTGTMWATGKRPSTSASPKGPSAAENVPGHNLQTVLEIAQKRGMKVGDVSTAEVTDATPAVLASHISLRGCQGPANMAACPPRPRLPAVSARSPNRRSTTRSTSCSAAASARFDQTITGGPDAGKTLSSVAQARGLPLRHRRRRARRVATPASRSSACSALATCRWSGAVRPPRPARATRPWPAPRAGARPNEPSLAAMTASRSSCSRRHARASSSRSREPRSTSRTTPPTLAASSVRRSPSTRRSASPWTTRKTIRTPWSSSPPTTRTPARSCPRTRPARGFRPGTRPTC